MRVGDAAGRAKLPDDFNYPLVSVDARPSPRARDVTVPGMSPCVTVTSGRGIVMDVV